jgi:hypothetical protein
VASRDAEPLVLGGPSRRPLPVDTRARSTGPSRGTGQVAPCSCKNFKFWVKRIAGIFSITTCEGQVRGMARCSAGPRPTCKIDCDGGCSCVYVYETNLCECECFESDGGKSNQKYNLGNLISISVADLQLGQVAARLDRLLLREVLVPASRAHEKVNLRVKRAPFSAVIRTLGLSTRSPVKARRASKR